MKMRSRRERLKRRQDVYDKTSLTIRDKYGMTKRPGSLRK